MCDCVNISGQNGSNSCRPSSARRFDPVSNAGLKIFTIAIRIYARFMYIMEIIMQVAKWGNSLAIRLPRSVVEVLGLKEGDSIEIHVADRRVFAIEKAPTSKQLLERLRKYRGRLPAGFKFDRLAANERS